MSGIYSNINLRHELLMLQFAQEKGAGISNSSAGLLPGSGTVNNKHRGAVVAAYLKDVSDAMANANHQQGMCLSPSLENTTQPPTAGARVLHFFKHELVFWL